ncbi:hypothetical protein [Ramlibacter sp.]|uniref:hypothetical protein n=1 Tax=Ramlibacter sp. TaxID=1917967 RepID=UPI00262636B5|nr:hypothetical protein [Ramlibacter sp.]MDB5955879.1 transposase [Ramlibacter sp.]
MSLMSLDGHGWLGEHLTMRKISMGTRKELVQAVGARYRVSPQGDRGAILDEFVATTGYHRKNAIRLLGTAPKDVYRRASSRRYGEPVAQALATLWEVSGRVCSKHLKPFQRGSELVAFRRPYQRTPIDRDLHVVRGVLHLLRRGSTACLGVQALP